MADTDVRKLAVRLLTSLVHDGKSLSELLPAAQVDLEAREAAMLQELAFGVCRNYGRLEVIIGELLQKPLRNKDTDVRMLLWLALYEIAFLSTPDYAVTSTYVSLTQKIKKNWAKGLVNATLRNFLRRQDELLDKAAQKNPHSLPEWMSDRFTKDWLGQASQIFTAVNIRAPLTLRVNVKVTDRQKLTEKFEQAGLALQRVSSQHKVVGSKMRRRLHLCRVLPKGNFRFRIRRLNWRLYCSHLNPVSECLMPARLRVENPATCSKSSRKSNSIALMMIKNVCGVSARTSIDSI